MLRGLEYLRSAGVTPDERVADAIKVLMSKGDADGCWSLDTQYPGLTTVELDCGEGRPSRWNTLRALRVMDWASVRGRYESSSVGTPIRWALETVAGHYRSIRRARSDRTDTDGTFT